MQHILSRRIVASALQTEAKGAKSVEVTASRAMKTRCERAVTLLADVAKGTHFAKWPPIHLGEFEAE